MIDFSGFMSWAEKEYPVASKFLGTLDVETTNSCVVLRGQTVVDQKKIKQMFKEFGYRGGISFEGTKRHERRNRSQQSSGTKNA